MITQETILDRLLPILKINSVKSTPAKDAPFGEGPKKALECFLSLADSLGFKTKNYDNYIGEAIFGEGEPFGILCHLDVVPVGNLSAWKSDPFTPTIRDGNLYCRGVLDDKSAAICALSALFEMKSNGITPDRQIRLIVGCDEESGWGCINHYRKCAALPEEGFSPDADFPVIYAEKGIYHIRYRFDKLKEFTLSGGVKTNVVCDYARAEGDFSGAKETEKVKKDSKKAESFGVAAHGSTPDKGDNALRYMTAFLEENGFIRKGICDDLFGKAKGAKELCDETGYLTFSPNVASTDNDKVYFTVDVRYPSTIGLETVEKYLAEIGEYEVISSQPPLFVDKNSPLVKTLNGVFNEVTGANCAPIAIGGGTYARALKRGVAFGPVFGEEGDSVHMPNEYIPLSSLTKMTEIYYKALIKLCTKN